MDYKVSIDWTYTWEMFQGFFTKKLFDDLALLLLVLWIVTKFTFIRIIIENTTALHGKK